MSSPFHLFEVSWEVCNKVGGIYTVLSTKAKTLVSELGDDRYLAIGPWLLSEGERELPFDPDPEPAATSPDADFVASCRDQGLPVRLGRWRIPGRPRTCLIEFSKLYEQKDDLLAELWDDFSVDSIAGGWDYVEPVLFGIAAGRVIETWWEHHLAPESHRAVVQAHEWMTGSSLLYLKKRLPSAGTIFTTHATMLGRALSSLGHSPEDGLGDRTSEELAEENGVVAKHSLEGVCAREADVFTTVSEITAREAELLHRRAPAPLLPNGIDLDVIDELAGKTPPADVRERVVKLASAFLGDDVSSATLLAISGRYEFHNKGIDALLDALALLQEREGPPVVLFVLVPAGNSGLRDDVTERLELPVEELDGPIGLSTHHLFDEEQDPVHVHCAKVGFENAVGDRVRVIQIPIYLDGTDGLLGLPYEAVLRSMDLTVFPSYYEPWGYTPQESLALGVPTITTDYAGFGRWAQKQEIGPENGLTVLSRVRLEYRTVVENLAEELETRLGSTTDAAELQAACRATAQRTSWSNAFFEHYRTAFLTSLEAVQDRLERGVPQTRRPKRTVTVRGGERSQRPNLERFEVAATVPAPLIALKALARNLCWSWDPDGPELFRELAPEAWSKSGHNPIAFLQSVDYELLERAAGDARYRAKLARVHERVQAYLAATPNEYGGPPDGPPALTRERPAAYFCAEFGLHESLPIYSGGLGILAGDHLKSASDLNVPLVAVGLFYREGYLAQELTAEGEQIAGQRTNDPARLPIQLVRASDGAPLEVKLELPGRSLALRAWRVDVGRVRLFLLDTDVAPNGDEDRAITRHLYGGDSETRILQEIVLGRGGVRMLRALGIRPSVWHMNEGHAAFLTLERVSEHVKKEGLAFEASREFVRATTLFTTHTPVPAGHDRFGEDLVRRYFSDVAEWVGVPWERFWQLGQASDGGDTFNMTYLALNFASFTNGVSQLHGIASRKLLQPFWPSLLEAEVPVTSITNGVHLATWTLPALGRALGADDAIVQPAQFEKQAAKLAPTALWETKRAAKAALFELVRQRLTRAFLARHDSPLLLSRMLDGLDEDALTIGFARRFAPYKRAHLLFTDVERLRAILESTDRPVRILVAGKAHPADGRGKDILRDIARVARSDEFCGRVFFVEDYDIELGRALVQGADVWLNTPTRMLEASGTSGMKAAANGTLNLSIGDGWWPEGFDGTNGWRVGDGRAYEDQELQDQLDASTLYRLLEEEIVPAFYERDAKGLPKAWVERMRASIATVAPVFNTDRMVGEYRDRAYAPLATRGAELVQDRRAPVKDLARECTRLRKGFGALRIDAARIADLSELRVGDTIEIGVDVELGELAPEDVLVEFVVDRPEEPDAVADVAELAPSGAQDGKTTFTGTYPVERAGGHAYGIRVRPRLADCGGESLAGLVLWA